MRGAGRAGLYFMKRELAGGLAGLMFCRGSEPRWMTATVGMVAGRVDRSATRNTPGRIGPNRVGLTAKMDKRHRWWISRALKVSEPGGAASGTGDVTARLVGSAWFGGISVHHQCYGLGWVKGIGWLRRCHWLGGQSWREAHDRFGQP